MVEYQYTYSNKIWYKESCRIFEHLVYNKPKNNIHKFEKERKKSFIKEVGISNLVEY